VIRCAATSVGRGQHNQASKDVDVVVRYPSHPPQPASARALLRILLTVKEARGRRTCGCREPCTSCDVHLLVYQAAEPISSQWPNRRSGGRGSSLCSRVAVDQVDQALPGRDQLGHVPAEQAPGRGKVRADRVAFAEMPGPVARPGRVEKGVPPPARHRLIDPKRRSERLGPRRRRVATVSRNVEVASPSWTWSQTRRVATRSSLCRS
jgi:hypothetical protein